MAAYFHGIGSEIPSSADGLQTLYVMNPNNYVPYSDNTHYPAPAPPNMFFLNPTVPGNALNHSNLSHAPPPSTHQPVFGITLPAHMVGSSNIDDQTSSSLLTRHEISGIQGQSAPRVQYHLWGPAIDQTASSTVGTTTTNSCGANIGTMDVASHQMGFRRPNQQGLSLSLSSQQTAYRSLSGEIDVSGHGRQFPALSPTNGCGNDDIRVPGNSSASLSNGITDMQNVILRSKYLKAAQELLDEAINVGKAINKVETEQGLKEKMKIDNDELKTGIGDVSCGASQNNSNSKQGAVLTAAQRQELQMKKTKLVSMLDEVEQRYRQYQYQIQNVVSSFEQAAGLGAAKSYTSLALKTISKQFRCLKDAISSQIKGTSHSLGEDHCLGSKIEGSRLRFVDHHIRQQRAIQQLGMIHHNAWRPQRGLPERAVSVLRAWLFEHFLHPYPKDTDKVLLAKQTGLTRSQVSNWFINARVRLWKPMVEEMYMDETKEQEHKNSGDNSRRLKESNKDIQAIDTDESDAVRQDRMKTIQSKPEMIPHQNVSAAEMSTSPSGGCLQSYSGFNLLGFGDMQRSPQKARNSEMQNSPSSTLSADMDIKPGETDRDVGAEFGNHPQSKGGYSLIREDPNQGGFPLGAYSMGDIGRFNSEELTPRFYGNGVSLSLGLHRNEHLSLSGNQHQGIGYYPLQNMQLGKLEIGANGKEFCAMNTPQSSYSSNSFDNINDIQNRKGFAAQLLPGFVAR